MSNKYTLKDPYKWEIKQSEYYTSDISLAVVYEMDDHTVIKKSRKIPRPEACQAREVIVTAMEAIKYDNPELFEDYDCLIDTLREALTETETLSDIQLSEILYGSQ